MARRNKGEEKAIASERIDQLVALADRASAEGKKPRADRCAELAWAIKTTYQLRATAIDGRRCRKCGAFLAPGTMRVRMREGKRVVTCLACGSIRRKPLAPRPKPI